MKFFATKYRELILTIDPKTFTVESGFRVTRGMNGLYPQGLSISFKDREFDTKSLRMNFADEMKLIKILKRHPSYGVSFVAEDTSADEEEVKANAKPIKNDKDLAKTVAATTDHGKNEDEK